MQEERKGVLLVEDDEIDVMTVQRAFKKHNIAIPLHVAESADRALALLRGADGPPLRPLLILFDLNLPRMDGIAFLRELRADPALRSLVAVALTSSNQPRDLAAVFEYNVAGYFLKRVAYEESVEQIGLILRYWLSSERAADG